MPDLGSLIRFAAAAYKSGDFQSAAEQLSICLKLSINGREIDQLTPEDSNLSMIAYLHLKYGQALLELARENENVLGEPIASKQAVNTSNYVNTEDSEVMCESEGLNEDLDEASDEDMEEMDINTVDLSLPIDGMAQDALKMASEICDDLQLAWEALDTSRILYQRLSMERVSVFLIDVYESLSEVCIESENWPGAHENLKLALETLTNNPSIPGSKRLMAEIHFKMALVSEYSSNFDDAIALLSDSKAILVKHQNELADVHEATELNDIILDINAKIEELKLTKKSLCSALQSQQQAMDTGCNTTNATMPESLVNDISCLVKKASANYLEAHPQISKIFSNTNNENERTNNS